jgi:membrane protein EpsK
VVVCFAFFGPSVAHIGAGMLLATIIGLGGDYILWRLLTPELSISPGRFDWARIRELFGMGGWVTVNQIGTLLFLNIDLIVVNIVLGAKVAGEYGSILLFSVLLRSITGTVAGVLYPTIVSKYAQQDLAGINVVSSQAVHLMGLAIGLPVGLLCGLGGLFLKLWLGPEFGTLWLLLVLMVFHLPINLAVAPLFGIQMALNKVKIPGIMTLVMGLGNLFLAILFTVGLNWGPYGVAAAAAIALTSKNAIFTLLYAAHIQKVAWHTFIRPILPGTLLAIVIGLLSWGGTTLVDTGNWTSLISIGLACGAIGIITIYLFGLNPGEQTLVLDLLRLTKND